MADRDIVARVGTFSIELISAKLLWRPYAEDAKLPAHKKVLRPLLAAATECWVYDIKPKSDVVRAAKGLLEQDQGRHRVRLDGDPITGHELFWNAHSGRRGTIVILMPRTRFDAESIFRGGHGAFVFENFLTAHTPAAIRFARQRVAAADLVAVCLPATNGMEWMDIFVKPKHALKLFDVGVRMCGHKWPE